MSVTITDDTDDAASTVSTNLTTNLNDILAKQNLQLASLSHSPASSSDAATTNHANIVSTLSNTLLQSQQLSQQLNHELSRHSSSSDSIHTTEQKTNTHKINTDYLMTGAIPKPRPVVRDSKYSPTHSDASSVVNVLGQWSRDKDVWTERLNAIESNLQLNATIQSPVKHNTVYRLENELTNAVDTIVQLKSTDNNKINALNDSLSQLQYTNTVQQSQWSAERQVLVDRCAKAETLNTQLQSEIHALQQRLQTTQLQHKQHADAVQIQQSSEIEQLKLKVTDLTTQLTIERKLNNEQKNTIFKLQQQSLAQLTTPSKADQSELLTTLDAKYQQHIQQLQNTVDQLTKSLNDAQKQLLDQSLSHSTTVTQLKQQNAVLQTKQSDLSLQADRSKQLQTELQHAQSENKQLHSQKLELTLRIDQLNYEINRLKISSNLPDTTAQHSIDTLQHTVEQLKLEIVKLQEQLLHSNNSNKQLQQRIDALQSELHQLQSQTRTQSTQPTLPSPKQVPIQYNSSAQHTVHTANSTSSKVQHSDTEHKSNSPVRIDKHITDREAVLEQLLERLVRTAAKSQRTEQYTTDSETVSQSRSRKSKHTRAASNLDDNIQLNVHVNLDEAAVQELTKLQRRSLSGSAHVSLSPQPRAVQRPHTSKSTRKSLSHSKSGVLPTQRSHSISRLSSTNKCQCGCSGEHYTRHTTASAARNNAIKYANPCRKCVPDALKNFSNYSHWSNQ